MKTEHHLARAKAKLSRLIGTALRRLLGAIGKSRQVPELPTFRSGGALVDIDNRDALYDAMDGR